LLTTTITQPLYLFIHQENLFKNPKAKFPKSARLETDVSSRLNQRDKWEQGEWLVVANIPIEEAFKFFLDLEDL
jgi:hypothetical protein